MTTNLWSAPFWKSTAERVVATLAAAILGVLASNGGDLFHINWTIVLTAGAVSLLKGVVANGITKTGPSLTNSEQVVPPESPRAAADQIG